MDILVFKILTDACFYLALCMPLLLFGPFWVRAALSLALAAGCWSAGKGGTWRNGPMTA